MLDKYSGIYSLPVVVWELTPVVIDPEDVSNLARWAGGYVSLKHQHISLPQRMHQVCTQCICEDINTLSLQ